MRIVMRVACRWQDAGQERVLNVGHTYDLPDAIAQVLVSQGNADTLTTPVEDELETKPAFVKRGRKAAAA